MSTLSSDLIESYTVIGLALSRQPKVNTVQNVVNLVKWSSNVKVLNETLLRIPRISNEKPQ